MSGFNGPNLASHFIQAHGGSGEVINQRVNDGPNTILDTTVSAPGADAEFNQGMKFE